MPIFQKTASKMGRPETTYQPRREGVASTLSDQNATPLHRCHLCTSKFFKREGMLKRHMLKYHPETATPEPEDIEACHSQRSHSEPPTASQQRLHRRTPLPASKNRHGIPQNTASRAQQRAQRVSLTAAATPHED